MLGNSCNIKVGGPCFFALLSSLSKETEFTKFVSEEIATARVCHASGRRRIPMPASRSIVHAVTATKHEPRLSPSDRVVSCGSALEVRALPMRLLSHSQCAGSEVFSVVPLQRAAWIRWPSALMSAAAAKLFFCCAQRNSHLRSRTSQIHERPRELGLRRSHFRVDRKRYHLHSYQLPRLVLQLCRCSIGFPRAWHTIIETLRTPLRLVTILPTSR